MTPRKAIKSIVDEPVWFGSLAEMERYLARLAGASVDNPIIIAPRGMIGRWVQHRSKAQCLSCGEIVPEADRESLSVLCARCLSFRADLRRLGFARSLRQKRTCKNCGGKVPTRKQFCAECATRRRRQQVRLAVSKTRKLALCNLLAGND